MRKGPKENAFYYFSVCLYRNFINFANYEEQSVHPCAFIVNQHKREELWIAQTSSEKKIKSLRTNQEISIQELAERAGLTMEQVSRIEENIDIPSLAPLIKIARALGVRLGTFLDDQTSEAGPVICRKGEADDTIGFSNNATHARQHMHYHSLSKSKVDRHMEPFIIDIDANDEKDFFLSAHEGEEFIMVLKGELEISYGKSNYRLKEGDTIYYDSIVPHHVHTAEGQAAQILAVVYTPV